ncbi:hypothetical protein L596_012006 [Steinernema carpocapsae]|uniref:G-protein coupled receptors family 1 profile domain-containing protein n=1 Tax=Steinernema carpocapsae TaxID=34508 RepID=A0A4U5NVP5_STECR|nr:hypothetical protein L596_012006 [Steinernema carpocapsae]
MVSMSTVDELISYILALPHLLANLAVLFISIRYVKPCAVRIYAFNLTIPSLVYSIYSLAMVIMKLSGGGRSFGVRDNKANTDFFDYLGTVVAYLCGYDYRMLAIVLVGVTFTAFAKPLYAKNILTDRTILCCFLLAHLAAVCLSTVSAFSSKQVQNLFLHGIHIKVDWTDYAEGIAEFGSFLTFVVLYVVCIREIVKFNNKQKLFRHNTRDQQVLKKQLLAILFYITPPTTFLIPYSLCTDISTTFIPSSTVVYKQICSIKINFYGSLIAIRYFVASFTILITFSDYRRVLLAKIFKTVPIFRGNANMVQSSSYM